MATFAVNQLQLAPLGAGDLIDRTVRLYRRHFMTLIRASAPPVVVSAVGAVLWAIGVRAIGSTESEQRLAVYLLLTALGVLFWFIGFVAQLIVMGGASRNLVMHLLRDEPVTARSIYRSVRSRLWGLVGATLAMGVCLLMAGGLALFVWYLAIIIAGVTVYALGQAGSTWVAAVVGLLVFAVATLGALWLFFVVAGRVAYVPQVMMVEGKGVFAAVGRSAGLARGNVRRLMAMFLFTSFATYSALMLLLIPLGWIGFLNGVDPLTLDASRWPVWYAIGYQVVWQLSTILLSPVWMLGLSLLYVDERVRHEGYDLELLTAQRLGEMPALPYGVHAPLTPAIVNAPGAAERKPPAIYEKPTGSVLGLSDRR